MLHDEAIALLQSRVRPIATVGAVAITEAAGLVLADSVVAPHPVPAHTNAAVDGYAFRSSPEIRASGARFSIVGRSAAGHPSLDPCPSGAAVRIFTGAVMPEGADTVVMQEDVSASTDAEGRHAVEVPAGLKSGANVRKAGEDVAAGAVLFSRGRILRPQDIAALASVGCGTVGCYRRIKVAVVSTGDEILEAGSGPLASGQVYDANAPMLAALCRLAGAECEMLGIWPDRADIVRDRLLAAASLFDVVITTGGASMGEEDHMSTALAGVGRRHMWQLAIKPGRPMMFGQLTHAGASPGDDRRDMVVLGLPGNPVAVFVCFLMYAYPLMRALGGAPWPQPRRILLPAAFEFTGRKTGRREFWRGILVERDGQLAVDKFARDGSGLITGLTAADGLIDIPEAHGDVLPGDRVNFIPFSEFGII